MLILWFPAVPVNIVISSGDIGIDPGQSVLITCISEGLPVPSVTWVDPDGRILTNRTSSRIKMFESLETRQEVNFLRSVLLLCDINRMDSGEYSCIADNTFSNDTATISVCALGNVHTIFGTCIYLYLQCIKGTSTFFIIAQASTNIGTCFVHILSLLSELFGTIFFNNLSGSLQSRRGWWFTQKTRW